MDNQQTEEPLIDDAGQTFDPGIHRSGDGGEPVKTKSGKFAKKRGPKNGGAEEPAKVVDDNEGVGPAPAKEAFVDVLIVGVSPMLHHRFGEAAEQGGSTRPQLVQETDRRKEAEKVAYKNGESFYFPGAAIGRLLREAGSGHKMKGSRKAAKWLVPAAVIVLEDMIPLLNGDGKTLVTDFEVDSRPVTIPATKGRIMRHRPRFDDWSGRFTLQIDPEVLPVAFIHQLLAEGGKRQGICDYRPEKGGPFGRFQVHSWKVRR